MNPTKKSGKFWIISIATVCVVLAGAAVWARPKVAPILKNWRVTKMNAEARAFLAKGDTANTLLLTRKALAMVPGSAEAWRIGVAAAKLKKTPEVIFYQDNLCRIEPTKENYLELIRMALEYRAYAQALEGIKAAAKDSSGDPEYHRLAVELYGRLGRATAAKYHLISLISLAPGDRAVQLKLAAIEMSEDRDRKNRDLRSRVRALADDPALRAQALSLLLREAVDAKLPVETAELLGRLKSVPDLTVEKQLLLIEASALVSPDSVEDLLTGMQAKVADSPAEAIKMLDFLRRTGAAKQAWSWYQKLPETTRANGEVMRAAAENLFVMQDWPALESFTRVGNWGDSNYVRSALLAYAYRKLGRTADFAGAWKLAVIAAGTDVPPGTGIRKSADLMARVDGWKWEEEHFDVLWKLFALLPRNTDVQQQLIAWERSQNHTANINKIFATILQLNPGDPIASNNVAYTSLLLDSNLAQSYLVAEALVKANPGDPYFATTRALALYKQGKFTEALEQMQSLGFAARAVPERMLLQAVFLAKAGEGEKAADLLGGVVVANLLPEEKKLRDIALADIAQSQRAQGNRSRLQTLKRGAETGGWLGLLDPTTQRDATVDMQLADSAYATGDFTALADLLKKADWGNFQYLGSALSTYLRRQRDGADASRETWKQALVLADKDAASLQNLIRLVTLWSWEPERLEALGRLFEKNPKDRLVMVELLKHFRETQRTASILKVLSTHLSRVDGDADERADFAYYSLISDQNLAQAEVAAKQAYDIEPDNAKRGLVQVFSLWKKKRFAEAAALLKTLPQNVRVENVPRTLVAAAVEVETGSVQAARASLDAFDRKTALPEEIAVADQIAQRIAAREKTGAN